MGKILAAALIAVTAVDKIKFDGGLYLPGDKVDGLTPEQAQGLVDNGYAKHLPDEAAAAALPTFEAGGGAGEGAGEGDAAIAAAAAAKAAAAKAPAAKAPAAKAPAKK